MSDVDAIVIGAGQNGLVAANLLADAGWKVLVLEANAECGGAVRTAEITAPGFRNDLFSAFYPFTAASPVIRDLHLADEGLRWTHAPKVLAHPRANSPAAVLSRDIDVTAASLDADAAGDGDAHRRLYDAWLRVADPLIDSLLRPFPPVRPAARLVGAAGLRQLRDLARLALMPLDRFVDEQFGGFNAPMIYAGNALHADLTPQNAGSALFGWLLVCLGQQLGFPVPVGGASGIVDALVRRLERRGGAILCNTAVTGIVIRRNRAVGVVSAAGTEFGASRSVLADTDATSLYLSLVGADRLPAAFVANVRRIERSSSTFKIDWALSSPIPWTDPTVHGAGTVHIADGLGELNNSAHQLTSGLVPDRPFLLIGQMTTADATRSPAGTESAWAYTHVPQRILGDAGGDGLAGSWDPSERERFAARMEARIEVHAPGFRDRILARHLMSPPDLQASNRNLVGGDISGGTAQLHQQLIFRPVPGLARAETPVRRLYLASASAHPGGAVHGAPGANAARAALLHHRLRR